MALSRALNQVALAALDVDPGTASCSVAHLGCPHLLQLVAARRHLAASAAFLDVTVVVAFLDVRVSVVSLDADAQVS